MSYPFTSPTQPNQVAIKGYTLPPLYNTRSHHDLLTELQDLCPNIDILYLFSTSFDPSVFINHILRQQSRNGIVIDGVDAILDQIDDDSEGDDEDKDVTAKPLSTSPLHTSITHSNHTETSIMHSIPSLTAKKMKLKLIPQSFDDVKTDLMTFVEKVKIFLIEQLHLEYNKFITLSTSLTTMANKIGPVMRILTDFSHRVQLCSDLTQLDLNKSLAVLNQHRDSYVQTRILQVELATEEVYNTLHALSPDIFPSLPHLELLKRANEGAENGSSHSHDIGDEGVGKNQNHSNSSQSTLLKPTPLLSLPPNHSPPQHHHSTLLDQLDLNQYLQPPHGGLMGNTTLADNGLINTDFTLLNSTPHSKFTRISSLIQYQTGIMDSLRDTLTIPDTLHQVPCVKWNLLNLTLFQLTPQSFFSTRYIPYFDPISTQLALPPVIENDNEREHYKMSGVSRKLASELVKKLSFSSHLISSPQTQFFSSFLLQTETKNTILSFLLESYLEECGQGDADQMNTNNTPFDRLPAEFDSNQSKNSPNSTNPPESPKNTRESNQLRPFCKDVIDSALVRKVILTYHQLMTLNTVLEHYNTNPLIQFHQHSFDQDDSSTQNTAVDYSNCNPQETLNTRINTGNPIANFDYHNQMNTSRQDEGSSAVSTANANQFVPIPFVLLPSHHNTIHSLYLHLAVELLYHITTSDIYQLDAYYRQRGVGDGVNNNELSVKSPFVSDSTPNQTQTIQSRLAFDRIIDKIQTILSIFTLPTNTPSLAPLRPQSLTNTPLSNNDGVIVDSNRDRDGGGFDEIAMSHLVAVVWFLFVPLIDETIASYLQKSDNYPLLILESDRSEWVSKGSGKSANATIAPLPKRRNPKSFLFNSILNLKPTYSGSSSNNSLPMKHQPNPDVNDYSHPLDFTPIPFVPSNLFMTSFLPSSPQTTNWDNFSPSNDTTVNIDRLRMLSPVYVDLYHIFAELITFTSTLFNFITPQASSSHLGTSPIDAMSGKNIVIFTQSVSQAVLETFLVYISSLILNQSASYQADVDNHNHQDAKMSEECSKNSVGAKLHATGLSATKTSHNTNNTKNTKETNVLNSLQIPHLYEQYALLTLYNVIMQQIATVTMGLGAGDSNNGEPHYHPNDDVPTNGNHVGNYHPTYPNQSQQNSTFVIKSLKIPLLTQLTTNIDLMFSQQVAMNQRLHHDFSLIVRKHTDHNQINSTSTKEKEKSNQVQAGPITQTPGKHGLVSTTTAGAQKNKRKQLYSDFLQIPPLSSILHPTATDKTGLISPQSLPLDPSIGLIQNSPAEFLHFLRTSPRYFSLPLRPTSTIAFLLNSVNTFTYLFSIPFTQPSSVMKICSGGHALVKEVKHKHGTHKGATLNAAATNSKPLNTTNPLFYPAHIDQQYAQRSISSLHTSLMVLVNLYSNFHQYSQLPIAKLLHYHSISFNQRVLAQNSFTNENKDDQISTQLIKTSRDDGNESNTNYLFSHLLPFIAFHSSGFKNRGDGGTGSHNPPTLHISQKQLVDVFSSVHTSLQKSLTVSTDLISNTLNHLSHSIKPNSFEDHTSDAATRAQSFSQWRNLFLSQLDQGDIHVALNPDTTSPPTTSLFPSTQTTPSQTAQSTVVASGGINTAEIKRENSQNTDLIPIELLYTIPYSTAIMSLSTSLSFSHLLASGLNSLHLQSVTYRNPTQLNLNSIPSLMTPHPSVINFNNKFTPLGLYMLSNSTITLSTYLTQHFFTHFSAPLIPHPSTTSSHPTPSNSKPNQSRSGDTKLADLEADAPNPRQFYADVLKLYLVLLKLPYISSTHFITTRTRLILVDDSSNSSKSCDSRDSQTKMLPAMSVAAVPQPNSPQNGIRSNPIWMLWEVNMAEALNQTLQYKARGLSSLALGAGTKTPLVGINPTAQDNTPNTFASQLLSHKTQNKMLENESESDSTDERFVGSRKKVKGVEAQPHTTSQFHSLSSHSSLQSLLATLHSRYLFEMTGDEDHTGADVDCPIVNNAIRDLFQTTIRKSHDSTTYYPPNDLSPMLTPQSFYLTTPLHSHYFALVELHPVHTLLPHLPLQAPTVTVQAFEQSTVDIKRTIKDQCETNHETHALSALALVSSPRQSPSTIRNSSRSNTDSIQSLFLRDTIDGSENQGDQLSKKGEFACLPLSTCLAINAVQLFLQSFPLYLTHITNIIGINDSQQQGLSREVKSSQSGDPELSLLWLMAYSDLLFTLLSCEICNISLMLASLSSLSQRIGDPKWSVGRGDDQGHCDHHVSKHDSDLQTTLASFYSALSHLFSLRQGLQIISDPYSLPKWIHDAVMKVKFAQIQVDSERIQKMLVMEQSQNRSAQHQSHPTSTQHANPKVSKGNQPSVELLPAAKVANQTGMAPHQPKPQPKINHYHTQVASSVPQKQPPQHNQNQIATPLSPHRQETAQPPAPQNQQPSLQDRFFRLME